MLDLFDQKTYPKSTLSLSDHLAKILVKLQDLGVDLKEVEVPLLGKQLDLSLSADHIFLSGKMLKELSPQTMAKIFGQLSKPLSTLGAIDLNGNCLIHAGFKYHKTEKESILLDILEEEVDEQYFLSEKQVSQLVRNPNQK